MDYGEEYNDYEHEPEHIDYNDEPEDEGREYVMGKADFDRVGGGGIRVDVNLKSVANPLEKFRIILGAIISEINTHEGKIFTDDDRQIMTDKVASTPFIQYKNPAAYILGYYVTKGGTQDITDLLYGRAVSFLGTINNVKQVLTPPDIIRYAYFWRGTLNA